MKSSLFSDCAPKSHECAIVMYVVQITGETTAKWSHGMTQKLLQRHKSSVELPLKDEADKKAYSENESESKPEQFCLTTHECLDNFFSH